MLVCMAQKTAAWMIGLGFCLVSLTACGGSTESGGNPENVRTTDAGVALATCSSGSQGEQASFDVSAMRTNLTTCQTDGDCTQVRLSSDCGNGCVSAVVSTPAAGSIGSQLAANPQRRCSACSVLLDAGSELTFDEACSSPPISPACVSGRCRLYHTA